MKKTVVTGVTALVLFAVWTGLVCTVDVQMIGESETAVGLATVNRWFHRLIGVHLQFYTVTDWLGLVPVAVCLGFGGLGVFQAIKRKSIRKVDFDILLLGCYYVVVILGYLMFETVPINYRPILIDGRMEASYPSSTTLLVLSVMPTLVFQAKKRLRNQNTIAWIRAVTALFTTLMVVGRMISGVHWMSDIVGAMLLSTGLFLVYRGICERRRR